MLKIHIMHLAIALHLRPSHQLVLPSTNNQVIPHTANTDVTCLLCTSSD